MTSSQRTLSYGRVPVRMIVDDDGNPWFAASDLYRATRRYTDRRHLACFDPAHLRLLAFDGPEGPSQLTAVSPLGALTIASTIAPYPSRMLDGWVRKRANEIADEAGRPHLGMTLLADGALPLQPRVSSDWYVAFKDLQRAAFRARRYAPNHDEPTLADEDTNFAPPADDASRARVAALMAEGERLLAGDLAAGLIH